MSKKNRIQDSFLEELRKIPIVQVACERVGVFRNSVYRWKREDKKFSKFMDNALTEGEDLVNDMSESQLLTLIKEKNFSAIRFWLNHRSPKFKDKVEVTTKMDTSNEELDPKQQEIVRKAFELASITKKVNNNPNARKDE